MDIEAELARINAALGIPRRLVEPERVLVLAGSAEQAHQWAREEGLPPRAWSYAVSERDVLGLDVAVWRYVLVGTWYQRPGLGRVLEELELRGFRQRATNG